MAFAPTSSVILDRIMRLITQSVSRNEPRNTSAGHPTNGQPAKPANRSINYIAELACSM